MFEGKAEEAMNFYVSLFPDAKVITLKRHPDGPAKDKVYQATFVLSGREFMCYDSPAPHGFTFTPAVSIFVECESKERIDTLAKKLSEGGQVVMPLDEYPFSKRFTWVQDKFGVSWQLKFN
ncbi:MAG: VOC family protein [Planctomycetes bacterium]|nr:VOC family protein [Planctomycetota bacterium]